MCGIVGMTLGARSGRNTMKMAEWMINHTNRGPDGRWTTGDSWITVGHALLSIQGTPQQGKQPSILSENGYTTWLTYNGEMYGVPHSCDTQFLHDGLRKFGIDFVRHRNWHGAFAFYEKEKHLMHLCRDHFGAKPLYYTKVVGREGKFGSHWVWASDLPSLLSNGEVSHKVNDGNIELASLRWSRFWPGRDTPIHNIYKLGPGEVITIDVRTQQIKQRQNLWDGWSMTTMEEKDFDMEYWKFLLKRSLDEVCFSNKKTAVLLSGGLDSTAVAHTAKKYDTFAVTTSYEKYDDGEERTRMFRESEMALQTAAELGMNIYPRHVDKAAMRGAVPSYLAATLVPYFDRQRLAPRYLAMEEAYERGAKIVLTGDCADEILTGYSGDDREWVGVFRGGERGRRQYETIQGALRGYLADERASSWFPVDAMGDNEWNNSRFYRLLVYGESFASVADHLAGHFGMESRLPFLHQDMVKYCMTIPPTIRLRAEPEMKGIQKYLLRNALAEELPDHVVNRKNKAGWAVPWNARDDERNDLLFRQESRFLKQIVRRWPTESL